MQHYLFIQPTHSFVTEMKNRSFRVAKQNCFCLTRLEIEINIFFFLNFLLGMFFIVQLLLQSLVCNSKYDTRYNRFILGMTFRSDSLWEQFNSILLVELENDYNLLLNANQYNFIETLFSSLF